MSEESKVVYCTSCGSENSKSSKFCSNCGTKLENSDPMQPVYETIEAEILESNNAIPMPEAEAATETITTEEVIAENDVFDESLNQELDIHYEAEDEAASGPVYQSPEPQYYSAGQTIDVKPSNGNIGFSIGSMVCGILAILCCCSTFLSIVLSIGAIVLGVIAIKNNYEGKGMAIAGLIMGGLGLLFGLAILVLGGLSGFFIDALDEIVNY